MAEIHEKENILNILESAKKAIKERDVLLLKELSNRTVHSASVYQDTDSITVAVIIYALYKILERPDYEKYKDWPLFLSIVNSNIEKAVNDLKKDKASAFEEDLSVISKAVSKLSGNFKRYIEEVFRTALISKASRIYEHGISMDQTASLLGITVFELAEYAGRTGISDVDLAVTLDIEKRLKKAMEFFT
jgi:hypothetical protein